MLLEFGHGGRRGQTRGRVSTHTLFFLLVLDRGVQQWALQADPQTFEELAIVVERYLTLGKLAKAKLGWQPVPKPRSQVLMAKAPTPSPVVGFNCGEHGHIRRECPKQSEPMDCSVGRTTRPLVSLAAGNGSPTETSLFRMLVQLEGQEVWALVDTGSNLTMISANLVPPRADQVLPPVKELCIHGDVEECPCVHLPVIKKKSSH